MSYLKKKTRQQHSRPKSEKLLPNNRPQVPVKMWKHIHHRLPLSVLVNWSAFIDLITAWFYCAINEIVAKTIIL